MSHFRFFVFFAELLHWLIQRLHSQTLFSCGLDVDWQPHSCQQRPELPALNSMFTQTCECGLMGSVSLALPCSYKEKLTADVSQLHVKAAVIIDTVQKWKIGVKVGRRGWQMSSPGKMRGETDRGSLKTLWNYHINGGETLAEWDVTDERTWGSEFLSRSCLSQARTVRGQLLSPPHDSSGITLNLSRSGLSGITAEWAWRAEPASSISSSRACFHLVWTFIRETNDFLPRQKYAGIHVRSSNQSELWTLSSCTPSLWKPSLELRAWTGTVLKKKPKKTLSYLCVK